MELRRPVMEGKSRHGRCSAPSESAGRGGQVLGTTQDRGKPDLGGIVASPSKFPMVDFRAVQPVFQRSRE